MSELKIVVDNMAPGWYTIKNEKKESVGGFFYADGKWLCQMNHGISFMIMTQLLEKLRELEMNEKRSCDTCKNKITGQCKNPIFCTGPSQHFKYWEPIV